VIILLTTSCQASLGGEGWFSTWSARAAAVDILDQSLHPLEEGAYPP
jgi:hypothetical protein